MNNSKILKIIISFLIIIFVVQIGMVLAKEGYPPVEDCLDKCYEPQYCGEDCRGLNGTCTGSNGNPGYRFECWSGQAYCCYYGN